MNRNFSACHVRGTPQVTAASLLAMVAHNMYGRLRKPCTRVLQHVMQP